MQFNIRKFKKEDIPAIFELIHELAVFEKAPEMVINTVKQMELEIDHFECFVAELDTGEIVGMALYYPVYYTWVGKSLYLDDLVVREKWRGNGIGRVLLNRVVQEGRDRDCKRIRWQVLDWNTDAIDFYREYGCKLDGEWLNCDLSFF